MVKTISGLPYYVVILTLCGCSNPQFGLFNFVPNEVGSHTLDSNGLWQFNENSKINITLYGENLTEYMLVYVSRTAECTTRDPLEYTLVSANQLLIKGTLPNHKKNSSYHICVLPNDGATESEKLPFALHNMGLQIPTYVRIIVSCILLILSGLFSGLNLGLMSLDLTSLRILKETGNESEQRYARKIEPVRKQGNFLLCTLLLGNVLVNSTLTILLDTLFGGLVAVIGSTAGIVVMGEIIPQAICQRFGLVVGAKTLFITKIFMILTCPLSWPISKLLDLVLGEELGTYYRREQLKELLFLTKDQHGIHKEEVNMITGVLSINEKKVKEIMTDIHDVYMLNIETKLDFEVMHEIINKGFSRIPVWEGTENDIVGLLFVKDLAFVDPDDELPLESVIKFYKHQAQGVLGDTTVFQLFNDFMKDRYHMAIVKDIEDDGIADPRYVTIGVITLEDIIEEIIQQEIVDETDAYESNNSKKKNDKKTNPLFPFAKEKTQKTLKISPQLLLATFTYLSTQIPEFSDNYISASILNKLLRQDVFRETEEKSDRPIIEAGKNVDFMIMVLTGEVKVQVGKENMIFVQGPFSTFCVPALRGPYIADISVYPGEDPCQYLYVNREAYKRAIEATKMSVDKDSVNNSVVLPTTNNHQTNPVDSNTVHLNLTSAESDKLIPTNI